MVIQFQKTSEGQWWFVTKNKQFIAQVDMRPKSPRIIWGCDDMNAEMVTTVLQGISCIESSYIRKPGDYSINQDDPSSTPFDVVVHEKGRFEIGFNHALARLLPSPTHDHAHRT